MELLADRFLFDATRIIDLATGREVSWRRLPLGSSEEQRAWADACAAALGAPDDPHGLIDFGYLGRAGRFEVYPRSLGSPADAKSSDPAAAAPPAASSCERLAPGWAPALAQMLELLDAGRPGRWRFVTVRLREEDIDPFVLALAHRARLSGFVPARLDLVTRISGLLDRLAGLHVLLIDRTDEGRAGTRDPAASGLLDLALRNARPNVVLRVRADPAASDARVEPTPAPADIGEGRSRDEPEAGYGIALPGSRVAEAAEPYDQPSPASRDPESRRGSSGTFADRTVLSATWPFVQAARGIDLVRRGSHAAGERCLRQALAALERRRAFDKAGETAVVLGRLLRDRGRSREALALLERARRAFGQSGAVARAAEAAVTVGWIRTDEGQLVEAEATLRGAVVAAGELGVAAVAEVARIGLARCLCWQGDFDEAEAQIAGLRVSDNDALESLRLRVAARIALLRADLGLAGRRVSEALERAQAAGDPRGMACGHALMAELQGRVGHAEAVDRHARRGLRAARAAHAPLVAVGLRGAWVEGLRAAGRTAEARRLADRLARYRLERLPALLRARLTVTLAPFLPVRAREEAEQAVEVFVRASGARAFSVARQAERTMTIVQDVIEVLRICQEAADEERALAGLCAVVRDRASAAAVVVRAAEPPDLTLSVAGPCRPGRLVAVERALASGLLVPPGRYGDGIEAAAPVRYGGRLIGALGCRWPADRLPRSAAAIGLITAAATASAPAVRALLDRRLAAAAPASSGDDDLGLLGVSSSMVAVRRQIARAAVASFPVLVEGESGSGKELVARAIHRLSARRDRRFAAINCAALPDELLEAELFGHARGAFTGALGDRPGLFEEADRGVLFLDEVGELSPRAQAKVLRALQEGEVRRVGENTVRHVDVRVVAATNRPLAREIAAGRFRQDLYYRLAVIQIAIPPLRDRPEDVPVLAAHFWAEAARQTGSTATLAPETLAALARYDWPGNVRELQNVVAVLALNGPMRGRVTPATLPAAIAVSAHPGVTTLDEARRAFERRFVRAALARAGGRRAQAAAELGLSRQGLAKLLRRLGLEATSRDAPASADEHSRSAP